MKKVMPVVGATRLPKPFTKTWAKEMKKRMKEHTGKLVLTPEAKKYIEENT